MPTFDTPSPISATIDAVAGELRIVAGDRDTTVVDVRPADASSERDVRDAEQTQVEYRSGQLTVRGPRGYGVWRKSGLVDVTIELPAGSAIDAKLGAGAIRCTGSLGEARLKSGAGDVQVEDVATLKVTTGLGVVTAESVARDAHVTTASGRVSVRYVGGRAELKNGNGDAWIGDAAGELRIHNANGNITAEHVVAGVTANTANGDIRLGELVHGHATLRTGAGRIEVGIRQGTAARLDVHTHFGRVVNELDSTSGPAETDDRAEVHARTAFGDIRIHRAQGVLS